MVLHMEILEISIRYQTDSANATSVRETERQDYTTVHKDYSESLDALERAIAVLKKQQFDRKQATSSLVAVKSSSLLPSAAKKVIDR